MARTCWTWPSKGRSVTAVEMSATEAFLMPWMMDGRAVGIGIEVTCEGSQHAPSVAHAPELTTARTVDPAPGTTMPVPMTGAVLTAA